MVMAYTIHVKDYEKHTAQPESLGLTTYTPHITVRAADRLWRLDRAADLEQLWEAMTANPSDYDDERLPYWTELWPASVALANWLTIKKNDICGNRCLDMGCGLGLTAMVAQSLGAYMLAMDYEFEAVSFTKQNAITNELSPPLCICMDWRKPAVQRGSLYRIWGGDIMYEKRFVLPVLRFLEHALTIDGLAWLAEPGRTVYDSFLSALQHCGWQGRPVYQEIMKPLYAQPVPVTVNVWELCRR